MAEPTCSITGCDKPINSRGWCLKHYTRWKRHGDPLHERRPHAVECRVLGCGKRARYKARRLCPKHYELERRHGDPLGPPHRPHFKTNPTTGCWEWTRYRDEDGYGRIGDTTAIRVYWQLVYGPVPKGWDVDHLCRNPLCVNPAHLEPVTHEENCRRGLRGALHASNGGS